MTIDFVSRPTTSDYMSNAMALSRSSLVSIAIGTFATVTATLSILVMGDRVSIIILLAGLSFLSGAFVVPFLWWAIHQRRDLVLAAVHVIADEAGITLETETSTARHAWTVFRRIRETSGAFIFDTGASVALLISKRTVSDADIDGLRSLMTASGALQPPPTGLQRLRPLIGVAVGLAATALTIGAPILMGPP